jgi:FHA domain/Sigma-54 interaction domain
MSTAKGSPEAGRIASGSPAGEPPVATNGTAPNTPIPTPVLAAGEDDSIAGLYPATYLGEFNAPGEWPFPLEVSRVVLGGSRKCDISIPGRGMSATHCMLERRANSIRVYDQHSTNGTYVGDTRIVTSWDVRIGDKFSPKPLTLFLMDDVMRAYRGTLGEILGTGFPPGPDTLLTDVVRQASHVLIVAEDGCGQDVLAKAIHEMSPRRAHPMQEITRVPDDRAEQAAVVRRASKPKTTVVLTIRPRKGNPPIDPTFISSLYSPSYGVRVIAVAPSEADAEHALPKQILHQLYRITLRPLAYRAGEIDQLLDRLFASRGAPHLRTADLRPENQEALRAYGWPKNLAQLHKVADAIVAHESGGGTRAAGRALGRAPSTVHEHLARVGLVTERVDNERTTLFKA